MENIKFKKVILFFAVAALFSSCTGMDGMLSSAGAYKLSLLSDDESLDRTSIIRENSRLEPFFHTPPLQDKDIQAVSVSFLAQDGQSVMQKVVYVLRGSEAAAKVAAFEAEKDGENEGAQAEKTPVNTENAENPVDGNAAEGAADAIVVKPLIITVDDFSARFPQFSVDPTLVEGAYTVVFEVQNSVTTIGRTEKQVYNVAQKEFSVNSINVFNAYAKDAAPVFSALEKVLFEADISVDESFAPYIIWREDKRIFAEGYVSDIGNTILWDAPKKMGFKNISAELFPSKQNQYGTPSDMRGAFAEVSVVISNQSKQKSILSDNTDDFTAWYRLAGTLDDENGGDKLASKEEPVWLGVNGAYGAGIGGKNALEAAPLSAALDTENTTHIEALFALQSNHDGAYYKAALLEGESSLVNVELAIEGDAFKLTLLGAGAPEEAFIPLAEKTGINVVFIDYKITKDGILVVMSGKEGGETDAVRLFKAFPPLKEGKTRGGASLLQTWGGVNSAVLLEAAFLEGVIIGNKEVSVYFLPPSEEKSDSYTEIAALRRLER